MAEPNVRNLTGSQQPEQALTPESMILVDEWAPAALEVWCELYADAPGRPGASALPPAPGASRPASRGRAQGRSRLEGIVLVLDHRSVAARWGELTHTSGRLVDVRWLKPASDTCTAAELDRFETEIAAHLNAWAARAYHPAPLLDEDAP